MHPLFWCERWDSNPHGVTTRTSNVLVYHSNTLASVLGYYTLPHVICQLLFPLPGKILDRFTQNGLCGIGIQAHIRHIACQVLIITLGTDHCRIITAQRQRRQIHLRT